MKYSLIAAETEKTKYDTLYTIVFEEDIKDKKQSYQPLALLDKKSGGLVAALIEKERITGKEGSVVSFYIEGKRYAFAGAGKEKKFNSRKMLTVAGKICKNAVAEKDKTIAIQMRTEEPVFYSRLIEAIETASYTFLEHFSEKKQKDKKIKLKDCIIIGVDNKETKKAVELGKIIGESRNFARTLVNQPSNYLTPSVLAKTIEETLKDQKVEILEKENIKKLKMGGLLGVNKGSKEDPRFIIIRHNPEKKKSGIKLALVGKAITFDTGGISLKPSLNMHEMKGDMAGGASVAALMKIAAELKIPLEIVGLIPSTTNMPDGNSTNPGDIFVALNGKTVEVQNTDAEGRLILMDALSYAVEHEKVTHIVDLATLTGAILVALGTITTGLFANDDKLANAILKATEKSGEYFWRMPMFDEYAKQLESKIADLRNIGGRNAGSITAAKFLEEFVSDTPWVHLDIAGTSYKDDHEYLSPSGTGETISTLTEWLLDFSK